MQTIGPNMIMLALRIALLLLFGYMYQWPLEKIITGQFHENEVVFWVSLCAYTIFPMYLLWTLIGVMWVRIDEKMESVQFCSFFGRINVDPLSIAGYFRTIHNTKIASYKGLIIKLDSGKVIEVSTYNLKSVEKIEAFLIHYKVPLWGNKDSWFPYKRRL
jgi:hypothetical protein